MASPDYWALQTAIVTTLKDATGFQSEADEGQPIHVTDNPTAPTMEQCPAVQVELVASTIRLRRLGAANALASPSDETVAFLVRAWGFSAEGIADARRQVAALVKLIRVALESKRTLGGLTCRLTIPSIQFRTVSVGLPDNLTMFQVAECRVELLQQS